MTSTHRWKFCNFTDISVDDGLWRPRLDANQDITVPYLLQMADETGIIDNFVNAAKAKRGEATATSLPIAGILNSDAVLYKIVEAASCVLARTQDPDLDARVDDLVAEIAAAQEDDGYLLTRRTIALRQGNAPPRWSNLGGDLELYIDGHLYEAAVAHYQATGKRTLLEVAHRR
ncbi:MAG: beta-L-arabinofuranosidase domain-containing protein [Anaerolineae bacterium]